MTDTSSMTTYELHCQDLAEVFLAEEPCTTDTLKAHTARVVALSLEIQQAVQNWLDEYPFGEWLDEHPFKAAGNA